MMKFTFSVSLSNWSLLLRVRSSRIVLSACSNCVSNSFSNCCEFSWNSSSSRSTCLVSSLASSSLKVKKNIDVLYFKEKKAINIILIIHSTNLIISCKCFLTEFQMNDTTLKNSPTSRFLHPTVNGIAIFYHTT